MSDSRRRIIGVWIEWEFELDWTAEGLSRLASFLVEGAAKRNDLTFRFVVSPVNHQPARAMLASLAAREGQHWTIDSPLPLATSGDRPAAQYGPLPGPVEPPLPRPEPSLAPVEPPVTIPTPGIVSRWLLRRPPSGMRRVLMAVCLATLPFQLIRVLLRPAWRFFWRHGLSAVPTQLHLLAVASRHPVTVAEELGNRLTPLPLGLGQVGVALRQWSLLNATPGHANRVEFANAEVKVDGWLLLSPACVNGLALNGRRVIMFADAIPMEFAASYAPAEWMEEGRWSQWWPRAQHSLSQVDGVITFSRHVAERHLQGLFGVDAARIAVIPHAPPDLSPDLPTLSPDRRRTPESRRDAANLLRRHAADRGWAYLVDFPFEDVNYVAVSTQDRPTKNIPIVIEAVRRLIRHEYSNVKLFMTTILRENTPGCAVPDALRETRLQLDAVSMPNLPKAEHAAFYHCAAVTVHPALFEGGAMAFPFPESVGLGTPCLMARGPHIREMLESFPELEPWVFDPYDTDGLVKLIRETIADRARVLTEQLASFERMRQRTWAQVANEYADTVLGRSGTTAAPEGHRMNNGSVVVADADRPENGIRSNLS
jgi:glycosyltransferase involved in cell wall biosynthesis